MIEQRQLGRTPALRKRGVTVERRDHRYRRRAVFRLEQVPHLPGRPEPQVDPAGALTRNYEYYDPVYLLPESGQHWWREQVAEGAA